MILFSAILFAQEKINEWHIIHRYMNNVNTQSLYTSNDTVIEGYTCQKIYDDNNIYKGALRNEEDRTFFYNQGSCDAVILYDYSLTVGDTVPNVIVSGEFMEGSNLERRLIVDSIAMDEIDGDLRKHIYFKPISDCIFQVINEEWIQGIGSVHGLLFPLTIRTLAEEVNECLDLTCFFMSENLIWYNNQYTECSGTYANGPTNVKETDCQYKIYPNPVKDIIHIESSALYNSLYIYNSLGNLIIEKQANTSDIDISNFPNGIYFVQIINQNGAIELIKIIKE